MLLIHQFQTFILSLASVAHIWPANADNRTAAMVVSDAPVYIEPSLSSQVIGSVPAKSAHWLIGAPQGTFVPLKLAKPIGNFTSGWVQQNNLSIFTPHTNNTSNTSQAKRNLASTEDTSGRESPANRRLIGQLSLNFPNPADWQLYLGEPQSSGTLYRYKLEVRQTVASRFEYGLGISYLSFSKQTAYTNSSATYSVTGYGLYALGTLNLIQVFPFSINAIASVGIDLDTAGNINKDSTARVTTPSIVTPEYEAKLELAFQINPAWSALGYLGYFITNLGNIATINLNNQIVQPNINLSSVTLGAGLAYAF